MTATDPTSTAQLRVGAERSNPAEPGDEPTCRWCGDSNVVFTNRLGPHCPDCYREGLIDEALHEASL